MSKIISIKNPKLHELVISRAESVVSTEIDDETVILDIASGVYSGLDQVGTTIWDMLEEPVPFCNIVKGVLAIYDVPEQECINDLIKFLIRLSEINLIVVLDA